MTGRAFSLTNGAGTKISEYQASVQLTGLSASTQYCYAIFSTDVAGAINLLPTAQPYQLFTTLDPVGASSTTPVTFDVIADTGENYSYTSSSGSGTQFPNYINPDQAAVYNLIGKSGAKFLLNAGDVAYSGGTQSNYGDLQQSGTNPEVSNIFGPSYYPQTGGIPAFVADGNHGQNVVTLRNWPTHDTASASGGTYAFNNYSGVAGITGSYPDNWYAFSTGNVRIYMLDASWSDSTTGNASGSMCTTPSYCKSYEADADEHWKTTSPEYQWLASDLASHQGGVKFAVFHYPLRSDNATQPSDPYLLNTSNNPNSLEKLLSDNGVAMAFNGHAHTYQRIVPKQSGQIINYVTGGGGGVLEPVLAGTSCAALQATASVYALGWTPSHTTPGAGTGSACGAPTPQSAADVFHFLKVTVVGNQVRVTPTNAAGATFDTQTYTVPTSGSGGGGGDTTPPTVPGSVRASTGSASGAIDVSWSASSDAVGVSGYRVYRDGGTTAIATVTTTTYTDTGLSPGSSHSYTVAAFDAAGNQSGLSSPPASASAGASSGGGSVTVGPSDDATISKLSANAGTNYGKLATLTVDGDQNLNDFLMKFSVPEGCTPSAASLTLTVGSGSSNGSAHGGDIYATSGSWSETTVTANNAPPVTGSPISIPAVAVSTPSTVDVTSLLSAANSGSSISLRVNATSNDAASYVSKDAGKPGASPKLALTC